MMIAFVIGKINMAACFSKPLNFDRLFGRNLFLFEQFCYTGFENASVKMFLYFVAVSGRMDDFQALTIIAAAQ